MLKRIIVTALLVCLAIGAVHAQRARDHIAQGREHLAAQRFEQAITSFQEALRLDPRNRDAPALLRQAQEGRIGQLVTQAEALVRENKFAEAIAAYDSALRIAPQGFDTSRITTARDRANTSLRARQQQEQQAREQREREAQAAREQQELERQQQELERQQQEQLARILAERSADFLENANILFAAGQYAEAITHFENAVTVGGLNESHTTQTQSSITSLKNLLEKIASYNRPVSNDDFEIRQVGNGVEITGFKTRISETVRVSIGGTNHSIAVGIQNFVIPNRLHGLPVTAIGKDAFRAKGLTAVTLPNTLVTINEGAFRGNRNLTRIVIPNSVTTILSNENGIVGGIYEPNGAFENCGLTTVTLGTAVRTIGSLAFAGNRITSLTLPASVRVIGAGAFSNNRIESLTIPNGVETIQGFLSYMESGLIQLKIINILDGNPLTTLVIPASLATTQPRIGVERIYGSFPNTLTRVTLPADVANRNMEAFEESLRTFYVAQGRRAGVYVKSGPVWTRQ